MISISSAKSVVYHLPVETGGQTRYFAIRPIIDPTAFPATWAACGGRKVGIVDLIARTHSVKRRTVYNWVARWRTGGIAGLEQQTRCDRGRPRLLSEAARNYLRAEVRVERRALVKKSVRAFLRDFQAQGSVSVPTVSYTAFRLWIGAIRAEESRARLIIMPRTARGTSS